VATRIVILEKIEAQRWRYVMWADVPAGRESHYADPNKKSAYKDISASDLTKIQAGTIVEAVDIVAVAPGSGITVVEAALQDSFAAYQSSVTSGNPWIRYGSIWDDVAGWTLTNNP